MACDSGLGRRADLAGGRKIGAEARNRAGLRVFEAVGRRVGAARSRHPGWDVGTSESRPVVDDLRRLLQTAADVRGPHESGGKPVTVQTKESWTLNARPSAAAGLNVCSHLARLLATHLAFRITQRTAAVYRDVGE